MKKILIKLIRLYQSIPTNMHNACRFTPTCSNYAIEAIEYYGVFKGSYLAIKRVLRCRPGGEYGYDPVIKEGKNEKVR